MPFWVWLGCQVLWPSLNVLNERYDVTIQEFTNIRSAYYYVPVRSVWG